MRGPKPGRTRPRRNLVDVLGGSRKRLSPIELFERAGFTEVDVEDFYEELRVGVIAGKIEQVRPNAADVFLKAIRQ